MKFPMWQCPVDNLDISAGPVISGTQIYLFIYFKNY